MSGLVTQTCDPYPPERFTIKIQEKSQTSNFSRTLFFTWPRVGSRPLVRFCLQRRSDESPADRTQMFSDKVFLKFTLCFVSLSDSLLKFWWEALKHSGGFGGFLWFELMWEQNSATCRTDVVFRHFNAGKLHIISSSQTKLLLMNWILTLWLLTYSLISSFIFFGCYGDS